MPKMFLISSSFNGQQLYLNHNCRKGKTIEQLFLWKWTFSTYECCRFPWNAESDIQGEIDRLLTSIFIFISLFVQTLCNFIWIVVNKTLFPSCSDLYHFCYFVYKILENNVPNWYSSKVFLFLVRRL